jgi:hypothetical protein
MGGAQGMGALTQALAPGGALAQPWTQTFQAPTAAQAEATPGYQFALQQGLQGIQAGAAAQGNLLSGGTQKSLAQFAQGLASTTYQQTYQNAMNSYQTNYNTWANNQQNLYNRLMGLTGTGLTANQGLATAQGGLLGNIASLYNANTNAMAGLLGAQGAAQAAGTMGQAGQLGGAINAGAQGLGGMLNIYAGQRPSSTNPYTNTAMSMPSFGMGNLPGLGAFSYGNQPIGLAPAPTYYGSMPAGGAWG